MLLKEKMLTLPKVSIGTFPTPLSSLGNFGKAIGCHDLLIKRDDLTGNGIGGNKIRSLEFLLGDALSRGCDTVIASGPLQSNLCTLAASAARKVQMECYLVHNGVRPEHAAGNVMLNELLDVNCIYLGEVNSEERTSQVDQLKEQLIAEGKRPYVIENGASTGRGALGYVWAVVEMLEQSQMFEIPLKDIYAPGGNGGVAAGLIYGNALLGFPFAVNIISVEYDKKTLLAEIEKIIREIEDIVALPFTYSVLEACQLIDDYRGQGWGENTTESEAMVHRFPQLEGIFIENVYTSKVLVGMEDLARRKKLGTGACYLHTGGIGSLFAQY